VTGDFPATFPCNKSVFFRAFVPMRHLGLSELWGSPFGRHVSVAVEKEC
jgi:hypothetical protein